MSRTVNKVILLGHVGQDPTIRFTPGGTITATMSLATNEPFKDAQGNWAQRSEWHRLVSFSKTAELVRDYVKKGAKLYVEGRIQTRSWEKDGVTHYRTEILVREIVFTGEPQGRTGPPQAQGPPPPTRTLAEELEATEITDEDVPF